MRLSQTGGTAFARLRLFPLLESWFTGQALAEMSILLFWGREERYGGHCDS